MGQYEIGHPQPESRDLAICPLVDKTAIAANNPGPCCDIGFGPHMPRRRPRSPRFASLRNLFREARPATPQR